MVQKECRWLDNFLGLAERKAETPDRVALLACDRNPLTYGQLFDHLQDAQDALKDAGLVPGEVAALALPDGPELITVSLALTGMAPCAPLDPTLTGSEYEFYLAKLGAGSLIVMDDSPRSAVDAARAMGIRCVSIHVRPDHAAGVFDVADAAGGATAAPARKIDAALLLFTSATTDSPKMVPLTSSNLQAIALYDSRALELSASDRLLNLMPLFHLYGFAAVLTQLFSGGSVVITPEFDPDRLLAWIADLRPTWITSNPPMNRAILSLIRLHPQDFRDSSLRFIRSGTAASEPELLASLETAMGVPVVNGYGMTEMGGITRNTQRLRKSGSVGRTTGLTLAVVDAAGNSLPPEGEGEIVVRGPSVTPGYVDNQTANEDAFRDGWFHTGDLGRLDAEGFLFITGRLKEVINRGGKKIVPQEVEEVLLAHSAVADAAACAIPHTTLGEDIGAAVVLREGLVATEDELRRFVAAKLTSFKVPRRIVIMESIPRTSNGKPKRGELAEWFQRSKPLENAPTTVEVKRVETILIDIWRRILGVEKVEPCDDFFASGGDSLSAAIMLTEAQRSLGTGTALFEGAEFFDSPTIESLALMIAERGSNAATTTIESESHRVLALRSTGSRVPIFCFPASAQDPYYFRHLAKNLDAEQPFFVVCAPEPVQDKRLLPVEDLARASVKTIRSARPHGPYILAGHCYGGVVAFESALQLMSEGEQVISLVLFDANTPGYPKVHKHWRRYVRKTRELAAAFGRGDAARTASAVRQHIYTLGRIFARRRTGGASRVLTAMGSDVLVAGRPEKDLNGMAMWEYNPRHFPARIIHFIAADHPISTEVLSDPRLGWSDFARAGLVIHQVPGDHSSLLSSEHAVALANRLTELLSEETMAAAAAG